MTSIFINRPDNLIVVGADVKTDYVGLGGLRRLISELKKEYDFDAFADLHDVIRTRIMGFFCRLQRTRVSRINKGRQGRKALTRVRNKVMLPSAVEPCALPRGFPPAGPAGRLPLRRSVRRPCHGSGRRLRLHLRIPPQWRTMDWHSAICGT